jgi:hypothetical protein
LFWALLLLLLAGVARVFGLELGQIFLILPVLGRSFVLPELRVVCVLEGLGFAFTGLFFVLLQLLPSLTYQFGNLGEREFLPIELIADFCALGVSGFASREAVVIRTI